MEISNVANSLGKHSNHKTVSFLVATTLYFSTVEVVKMLQVLMGRKGLLISLRCPDLTENPWSNLPVTCAVQMDFITTRTLPISLWCYFWTSCLGQPHPLALIFHHIIAERVSSQQCGALWPSPTHPSLMICMAGSSLAWGLKSERRERGLKRVGEAGFQGRLPKTGISAPGEPHYGPVCLPCGLGGATVLYGLQEMQQREVMALFAIVRFFVLSFSLQWDSWSDLPSLHFLLLLFFSDGRGFFHGSPPGSSWQKEIRMAMINFIWLLWFNKQTSS